MGRSSSRSPSEVTKATRAGGAAARTGGSACARSGESGAVAEAAAEAAGDNLYMLVFGGGEPPAAPHDPRSRMS